MKNITNMGPLRSCVLILLMFVQLQTIAGKPFLTSLLCDLMCDDDDDVTTTTSSSNEDDYWDLFGLCTCGTRRPPGTRRGQGMPGNINMRLPPSANGMNFSMTNNNGLWSFNLDAGPNRPSGGMPLLVGPTTLTPTAAGGAVTTVTSTTAAPAGKK